MGLHHVLMVARGGAVGRVGPRARSHCRVKSRPRCTRILPRRGAVGGQRHAYAATFVARSCHRRQVVPSRRVGPQESQNSRAVTGREAVSAAAAVVAADRAPNGGGYCGNTAVLWDTPKWAGVLRESTQGQKGSLRSNSGGGTLQADRRCGLTVMVRSNSPEFFVAAVCKLIGTHGGRLP